MADTRRPLLERLIAGDILVADGAMGTILMERGLEPGQCPESLNVDSPEVLEDVARQYLRAGADIIQTNTFGGSPLKLAQHGLGGRADEINRRAVAAVRRAVGDRAFVSGSCGPTGRLLQPYGDASPESILETFCAQMKALAEEGVDVFCVETMTDLNEAGIAIKAARDVAPRIPVMATLTFDPTPRGFFTMMGVTVQQAAAGLAKLEADVVGSNCGNGIENMLAIAAEFRNACNLPLIIQSNAGFPETRDGELVYSETAEFMASKVPQLAEVGISIIGGCCGTTPEHVAAIRVQVDALRPRAGSFDAFGGH